MGLCAYEPMGLWSYGNEAVAGGGDEHSVVRVLYTQVGAWSKEITVYDNGHQHLPMD